MKSFNGKSMVTMANISTAKVEMMQEVTENFAPISHDHEISEINGLTASLASKVLSSVYSAFVSAYDTFITSISPIAYSGSCDDLSDGTTKKTYSSTEKTKLSGIATSATANDTDANLKARTNHTGSQAISTITGLQTALDGKQSSITAAATIIDASTNAATNAPTNLNVVTTLLGSLTGEVNAANTRYNDLAGKYNDLANKTNSLFAHLESQNLQLSS